MQKPEVRIIEEQSVLNDKSDVNQYEINDLLSKYGYFNSMNNQSDFVEPQNTHLSFEEMIILEEKKNKEKLLHEQRFKENQHRGFTFDDVNSYESRYSSIDVDGHNIGIQVSIASDMNIFQNNRKNI